MIKPMVALTNTTEISRTALGNKTNIRFLMAGYAISPTNSTIMAVTMIFPPYDGPDIIPYLFYS